MAGQGFDGIFTLAGMAAILTVFVIDQRKGAASLGVFCPKSSHMRGDSGVQIIGDTGVEAVIGAFKNIDDPLHRRLHPVACFAYA